MPVARRLVALAMPRKPSSASRLGFVRLAWFGRFWNGARSLNKGFGSIRQQLVGDRASGFFRHLRSQFRATELDGGESAFRSLRVEHDGIKAQGVLVDDGMSSHGSQAATAQFSQQ